MGLKKSSKKRSKNAAAKYFRFICHTNPLQLLVRWWGMSDTLLRRTSEPSDASWQSKMPPRGQVSFLLHWPTHKGLRLRNKCSFLSVLVKDWLFTNRTLSNFWPIASTRSGFWVKHTTFLKIQYQKKMFCSKCLKWSLTEGKHMLPRHKLWWNTFLVVSRLVIFPLFKNSSVWCHQSLEAA